MEVRAFGVESRETVWTNSTYSILMSHHITSISSARAYNLALNVNGHLHIETAGYELECRLYKPIDSCQHQGLEVE